MPTKYLTAKPMRIISVTGGKGGIGKTTLSVNLAVAFAKMRQKVLLMDADLGLANVDLMLGLTPTLTLKDVLQNHCDLNQICLTGPYGLKIIPASSGMQQMTELNAIQYHYLIKSFSSLVDRLDVMLIDLASGISSQVINFTNASQDILIVLCNDPSSLMDSYAVIKILRRQYARKRFGIVVNKTKHPHEGPKVFANFQEATEQLIDVSLHYLGEIPEDDYIYLAARERLAVVDKYPAAPASIAINTICKNVMHWQNDLATNGGIHFFFERLIQVQ